MFRRSLEGFFCQHNGNKFMINTITNILIDQNTKRRKDHIDKSCLPSINSKLNYLLVGSTATGKTMSLKIIQKLIKNSIFTSANHASQAGLLATVKTDRKFMDSKIVYGSLFLTQTLLLGMRSLK